MQGNNDTLQEGIRTFANAFARPVAPPRPPAPPASSNGHSIPPQTQTAMDILEEAYDEPAALPPPPAKKGSAKRKYSTPQVINIDLNGGDVPLEEFCKQKNPSSTVEKYLAIAVWLKEYRGIEVVTADHIFTCFKKMHWSVQADMSQPLRSAKSERYMDSGTGRGEYKINHIGEDKVRKMGGG